MQRWSASTSAHMRVAALGFVIALSGAAIHSQSQGASPAPSNDLDIFDKTIPELQAQMQAGRISSQQLVEVYSARIRAYDQSGPRINAMIALNPHALEAAAALDAERRSRGPRGPLH